MTRLKPTFLFILLVMMSISMPGCNGLKATHTYHKDRLSFSLYENWEVNNDFNAVDVRHVAIKTPGLTQIAIEIRHKNDADLKAEYLQYDASLREFASRYNKRDIDFSGRTPQPVTQSAIRRRDQDGLKETQKFIVDFKEVHINRDSIHEFYRFNTQDQIIFIALDTSGDEYEQVEAGFELILTSLNYYHY